jgi:hypothetical protein
VRSAVRWDYGTIIIASFVAVIVAFAVHCRTHGNAANVKCGAGGVKEVEVIGP